MIQPNPMPPAAPDTSWLRRNPGILILAGLAAAVAIIAAVVLLIRPDKADEFRGLYDDTAAVFVERGDDLPPFFDPAYMDVRFTWDNDVAQIHATNITQRHAEYDPGYEAYRACEWAQSWVYEHGSPDTDLEIYVDDQLQLVLHDSMETCATADAD